MSTLFLDDDPERLRWAKQQLFAVCVSTAQECIDMLGEGPWGMVCLDHDLGGESDDPKCEGPDGKTGLDVVRWIVKHRPTVLAGFLVHSLNAPAAERMVDELTKAGYHARRVPFTSMRGSEVLANELRDTSARATT